MSDDICRFLRFEVTPSTDRWNRRRWHVIGWFQPSDYPTVAEFHQKIATCHDAEYAAIVVTALRQSLAAAQAQRACLGKPARPFEGNGPA